MSCRTRLIAVLLTFVTAAAAARDAVADGSGVEPVSLMRTTPRQDAATTLRALQNSLSHSERFGSDAASLTLYTRFDDDLTAGLCARFATGDAHEIELFADVSMPARSIVGSVEVALQSGIRVSL